MSFVCQRCNEAQPANCIKTNAPEFDKLGRPIPSGTPNRVVTQWRTVAKRGGDEGATRREIVEEQNWCDGCLEAFLLNEDCYCNACSEKFDEHELTDGYCAQCLTQVQSDEAEVVSNDQV